MAPKSKRAPKSDASGSESSDDDSAAGSSSSENESINGNGGTIQDDETYPELSVDVTKLNPLSPEVIQKQATINIGGSGGRMPSLLAGAGDPDRAATSDEGCAPGLTGLRCCTS
jgi:hypothetical protein